MSYTIYTIDQRPDLVPQLRDLAPRVWPAFMMEDMAGFRYWNKLYTLFPEYQSIFVDETETVIASAYAIPLYWDGTLMGLPRGWDDALAWGFADRAAGREPNCMSALAAEILPEYQGRGLSAEPLKQMRRIAESRGFQSLIAPVRPTLKASYPLIPFDDYIRWSRPDGLPFDPWMRTHARLGAEILISSPLSMYIPGTIAQWEEWTGMLFPMSGHYVVKGALQPVLIDRERDLGEYYDPNVWMCHALSPARPTGG